MTCINMSSIDKGEGSTKKNRENSEILQQNQCHYLRGRILKSNILSNKVLPFHNGTSTTEGPSPYYPRRLQKWQQKKKSFFDTYPLIQMTKKEQNEHFWLTH